jgi:hypothetical protein
LNAAPEIGLISDTHGLLRPEALSALEGVDHVIHAGDVGPQSILDELAAIAPVTVVRGNTDHGGEAAARPLTNAVEIGGRLIYVVHDIDDFDVDPEAAELAAVVYGHSHRPTAERRGDTLSVNPGAAGHRRLTLPITVARLRVRESGIDLRYVDLETSEIGDWDSYAL